MKKSSRLNHENLRIQLRKLEYRLNWLRLYGFEYTFFFNRYLQLYINISFLFCFAFLLLSLLALLTLFTLFTRFSFFLTFLSWLAFLFLRRRLVFLVFCFFYLLLFLFNFPIFNILFICFFFFLHIVNTVHFKSQLNHFQVHHLHFVCCFLKTFLDSLCLMTWIFKEILFCLFCHLFQTLFLLLSHCISI